MNILRTILPTDFGTFTISFHKNSKETCLCLHRGNITSDGVIVRLHSSCLFGETFFGTTCDCKEQLREAMKVVANSAGGVIVYLFQEGRGHGIEKKILSTFIEYTHKIDTIKSFETLGLPLDVRTYDLAFQALKDLNVSKKIRLITNNPHKELACNTAGYEVIEKIELNYKLSEAAKKYLHTKRDKMGHTVTKI